MTRLELQLRIKALRDELETRHKFGTIKMAKGGIPIPVKELQEEMYHLIYRLSKVDENG